MTLASGTDRLESARLGDVLQWPYAISAILPRNARSLRVAERSGARPDGQMHVVGANWDRYLWPLAVGDGTRHQPVSTK